MAASKLRITRRRSPTARRKTTSTSSLSSRRKFHRFFPRGFKDQTYVDWERGYKWNAHEQWNAVLNRSA